MTRPARVLSRHLESLDYVHADDGLPYRHRFGPGARVELLDDGSVQIRNKNNELWGMYETEHGAQPFLENPRGHSRSRWRKATMARKRKRRSARKMSAAQARYFGPRRKNAPKRRRKVVRRRRNGYAAAASNPPRHHRRRRRRNPPAFSVNGLLRSATTGAMDGVYVVGGKLAAQLVSGQFNYPDGSILDTGIEVAVALALAFVAPRVVGLDATRFLVAGAFASPIETLVAQLNIPGVSDTLKTTKLGRYAGMGRMGRSIGDSTTGVYPQADPNLPARNALMISGVDPSARGGMSFGPELGRIGGYAGSSSVPFQS